MKTRHNCSARDLIFTSISVIAIVLAMMSNKAIANNYYFSASLGKDSYTRAQAQNPATPWQSISKLNSTAIAPGDSILFKRGDIFYGSIIISKSGTSLIPIVIGAYGIGDKPIVTGFTIITGWKDEGNGIYSKVITSESQTNMVTIDGDQYGMGRFPNVGTNLTYESAATTVSITDNQLSDTPNWTGADAVITKNGWNIDRCPITNHTGNIITAHASIGGTFDAPNNYFIQNDIRTLDQFGEWYHNFSTGRFYMYFGAVDPNTKTVQVATLNNLLYCSSSDYLTIDNISFNGSIRENIKTSAASDYLIVQNCIINFSGLDAIFINGFSNIVRNNSISNCNKVAIYGSGDNFICNDNTILNCGIIEGMGNVTPLYSAAIFVHENNPSINRNSIANCGFNGIQIYSHVLIATIKNNFIENTCTLRSDQGSIYTSGNKTSFTIDGNIVVNSKGVGIYLDEYSTNVSVTNNTVAGDTYYGIKLHKANHNTITGNTCYNNGYEFNLENWLNEDNLGYNVITGNKFIAKLNAKYALRFVTKYTNYLTTMATCTIDNNYYARAIDDSLTIYTNILTNGAKTKTLAQWKTLTSQDVNSQKSPKSIITTNDHRFEYNASNTNKVVTLDASYIDVTGKTYNGTITLAPYTSLILIKDGVLNNQPPSIQNQSFLLKENSPNGSTFGAILASDPDPGQILIYSILSGNTNGAFAINASSGVLTVANSSALNFEITPTCTLVVRVQDNGTVKLSSEATVTIPLTNVNEPPVIKNQSFSIAENSANGATVGTVVATDPDAGQTKTFSILSGNTSGAFAINSSNGVLTVANSSALNFESTPAFSFVVKVQDNGTGNLSSQATVTISLTDVNEPPVINNQSFSIDENSANGATVGTVVTTEPDAGQTQTFSILSGNISGTFAINSSNGVLTVANSAALNFESTPAFYLVVKVQDNGTGNLSSQAIVSISLTNVNEPPVINNQSFSITENSANGATVGTVVATDPDAGQTKTFSILSGNTSGAFSLNAVSGVLTMINSEALNFSINPIFSLGVKVSDNGTSNLFNISVITVNILPGPNQPPVITDQTFAVSQNTPTGTLVGIVEAADPDAEQLLVFSIASGNVSGTFAINSSTGEISVANPSALALKSSSSVELVVKVQDNGSVSLSNQALVTVLILAANAPPVIHNQTKSTLEHQPSGTVVGNIQANDPDSVGPLQYSITSGNIGYGFALDAYSGLLTINNPSVVCFEDNPVFYLSVKVQNIEGISSKVLITVNVADINETPVCKDQIFSIAENASIQTVVGAVIANDYDFNQTLTYSILAGNSDNAFTIGPGNGLIKVNNLASINFEAMENHSLVISVQDNGQGNLVAFSTIKIDLIDVNEAPVMENQELNVVENSAPGAKIGYLIAIDPDKGQKLTYKIESGNEGHAFNLNDSSGLITVADPSKIYYGRNPLFVLTVIAQDNGIDSLSTLSVITINILKDSTDIIQSKEEANPVADAFTESDISIYPNPTLDIVNFNLDKVIDKSVRLRIFTITGIEIYSTVTKGKKNLAINMAEEKPGTYIALITVDGIRYSRNIIAQN